MAEAPSAAAGESPAQLKARLRRERLAAKSGASRLQQITALQGGPPRDVSELEKDVPAKPAPTATPDPDEIDISQHHFTPASQPHLPSPFAFDGPCPPAIPTRPSQDLPQDPPQDPVMAMLQQMMGGAGAGGFPGVPGGTQQLDAASAAVPPGFASLLSAMQGGSSSIDPDSQAEQQSSAWVWRLVHSLFSFGLAIYIVLQTPFTGSKLLRHSLHDDDDWTAQPTAASNFDHFFYLFATFEVVLQSSRYFVEKGQLQGSSMLNTVAGILPPPYGSYARALGRYSVIWSTVVSDAMVIVFVLGATTWWKGAAVA